MVHTGVAQAGFCLSGRGRDRNPSWGPYPRKERRRGQVVEGLPYLPEFAHDMIKENFRDGHSEVPPENSLVWQRVQDGWMRS